MKMQRFFDNFHLREKIRENTTFFDNFHLTRKICENTTVVWFGWFFTAIAFVSVEKKTTVVSLTKNVVMLILSPSRMTELELSWIQTAWLKITLGLMVLKQLVIKASTLSYTLNSVVSILMLPMLQPSIWLLSVTVPHLLSWIFTPMPSPTMLRPLPEEYAWNTDKYNAPTEPENSRPSRKTNPTTELPKKKWTLLSKFTLTD